MKPSKTFVIAALAFHFALFATHYSNAQVGVNQSQTTRDALNGGGALFGINRVGAVASIVGAEGGVIGTQLLDTVWREASIKLYKKIGTPGRESDSIAGVPVRYDIFNNDFDVMVNSKRDIRGLDGESVKHFTLYYGLEKTKKTFLNVAEFKAEEPLTGFMELLVAGKTALLEQIRLSVTKPTFNMALNSGSKDSKINKTPHYYYLRNNEVRKLATSKKKIIEAFADKEVEIKKWLDSNNINLKSSTDLARLFIHYNSL